VKVTFGETRLAFENLGIIELTAWSGVPFSARVQDAERRRYSVSGTIRTVSQDIVREEFKAEIVDTDTGNSLSFGLPVPGPDVKLPYSAGQGLVNGCRIAQTTTKVH